MYLAGCLISWCSRAQRTVALSSTTAEYIGVTEICKEVLFIRNIGVSLGLKFKLPIIILCDNIGAVFLSKNNQGKRTKYLDTQYHFVREYVENGTVVVVFVRSEENRADPFTKNVTEIIYARHSDYFKS